MKTSHLHGCESAFHFGYFDTLAVRWRTRETCDRGTRARERERNEFCSLQSSHSLSRLSLDNRTRFPFSFSFIIASTISPLDIDDCSFFVWMISSTAGAADYHFESNERQISSQIWIPTTVRERERQRDIWLSCFLVLSFVHRLILSSHNCHKFVPFFSVWALPISDPGHKSDVIIYLCPPNYCLVIACIELVKKPSHAPSSYLLRLSFFHLIRLVRRVRKISTILISIGHKQQTEKNSHWLWYSIYAKMWSWLNYANEYQQQQHHPLNGE